METDNKWIAQLSLPGLLPELPDVVGGVEIKLVRGYLLQLQALDMQAQEIKTAIKELKSDMASDNVPVKTVMAALGIVKAHEKARCDASAEFFAACIVLADSLIQKESE